MNLPRPRRLHPRNFAGHLQTIVQADSIDEFARGCEDLLRTVMPVQSLCVSFSRLEYVCPWLIRDTLPIRCDLSYINERYHVLNPSRPFLSENVGIEQGLFKEQVALMPDAERETYLRRFKHREGWDKYAEIYFWDDKTLQANICIRRASSQRDFTADDLRILAELRVAFSAAVNRLHRQHRERSIASSLHQVLGSLPVPLLILGWNLEPISFNAEARRASAEWILGPVAARALKLGRFQEIPPAIIAGCEAEKERLACSGFAPSHAATRFAPRFRTIHHETSPHLSAQLEVLEVPGGLIALPNFLLRFQSSAPQTGATAATMAPPAHPLTALSCLTPCEREVALLVKDGLTNHEIAARLSKGVATVKMHLRSVLRKLQVSNRTRIALRMMGQCTGAATPQGAAS